MTEEKSSAFRARLIGVAGNSVTMEVLDGEARSSDELVFCGSAQTRKVLRVSEHNGHTMAELDSPVEAQVGEIVARSVERPEYVDQFEAKIFWMSEREMLPGRSYSLICAGQSVEATITKLKYKVEEASGKHIAANSIAQDETFIANLSLDRNIAFDPGSTRLETSRFELRSGDSKILARGEIRHSLRRASNVHWQALAVDKIARSKLKNQTPKIIWLTGLSASGKSTIANIIEKKLLAMGKHAYLLDGDNVRHGLNKDLGFTAADRVENIRRIAETSKLMLDAGLIVIASFISPFRAERRMARSLFEEDEFIEVHVDASLAICEERDPKGLYKKVRRGAIRNFTGFDSPYDRPENPEIRIDTETVSAEEAAIRIIDYL
jgi:bifunctional enzyme CysN/CysC